MRRWSRRQSAQPSDLQVRDRSLRVRDSPLQIRDSPLQARDVDTGVRDGDARACARQYRLAAVLFALGALILASPWLTGAVTIPFDAKAQFYPQFVFLAKTLHAGQSPFWTSNIFDGSPQIADPQSLVFAPAFVIAAWLTASPGFILADAIVFGSLAAGGLALIALFRDRQWHPAGALLAAFAFAFGGSAAWRLQHVGQVLSLAWFPLAWLVLSRALDRASVVWGALAGLCAALVLLGRDQVAMLELFFLAAYAMMRMVGRAPRLWLAPLAAGAIVGALVVALPLAFTLVLATQSNRPEIGLADAVRGSLHPASLLTLVSANLFGIAGPLTDFWGPPSPAWGETGLFLARNMTGLYMGALVPVALVTLLATRPRAFCANREVAFVCVATVVLLLYAFGGYTPVFDLFHLVPGVALWRRPADATFPLGACLAVMGGYALHVLVREPPRERRRALLAILALLLLLMLCGATAWAKDRLVFATPALSMAAVFSGVALALILMLRKLSATVLLLGVGALMTADLATGNAPNESTGLPPAEFAMLRPDTSNTTLAVLRDRLAATAAPNRRDRVELAGLGFAWPNASLVHGLDNDLGYNPVRSALFEAFTGAGDHVALPKQRVFSPAFASYRSPAADLSGLRFIATGVPIETIDPKLRPGDLRFIARTADAYIYENPRALPRVLLATRAVPTDFGTLLRDGAWPPLDYARTVLFEAPTGPDTPRRDGTARIESYGTTDIVVRVEAPDGGWLVLNDIWHPWWRATIDDAPAAILRANGAFRAVAVRPGSHTVRFSFHPVAGVVRSLRDLVAGVARAY